MDPLSIASAASGLVVVCTKCSVLLYKYIEDVKSIDSTVGLFCSEIDSLAQVLDAISTSFNHPPTIAAIAASQNNHGRAFWINVAKLLEKCGTAMSRLRNILQRLENTRGGILRRPIKQIKFSMKSADIVILRQQVNLMMQIALQSISVCLQLHGISTSEDTAIIINCKLDKIRDEIQSLQKQSGGHTTKDTTAPSDNEESSHLIAEAENQQFLDDSGLTAQDLHIASNEYVNTLEDYLQSANGFVSSARTVVESRTSAAGSVRDVTLGSELGEPLTTERRIDIEEWIPKPALGASIVTSDRRHRFSSAEVRFLGVCHRIQLLGLAGDAQEAARVGMEYLTDLWNMLSKRLRPYYSSNVSLGRYMGDPHHGRQLQRIILLSNGRGFLGPVSNPCRIYTVPHFLAHLGCTAELSLLYDRGHFDPNAKDHVGKTPLIRAAHMGHTDTVAFLLEQPDIDANVIDDRGGRPLTYVKGLNHGKIVDMLKLHIEAS